MSSCKFLFIIFVLLFIGIFAQQRFKRLLVNDNQNGLNLDMIEMNGNDLVKRGKLASDDDNINTLEESNKHYEVELLQDELKFRMCTNANECYAGIVILCFDSDVPNSMEDSRQCRSNQCEFQAGFSRDTGKLLALFFAKNSLARINEGCGIVTMKSPKTKFFNVEDSSCFPKIYDGNVVKIDVKQASPRCKAKIIGAREWTPPTSTVPLITSRNPTSNAKESSISEETMWIIIAVVVVLLVIILACAGFWGYRCWKQKKTVTKSDGKKKEILPDLKIAETTVVKQEKAIEETVEENPKTTKDETVEEKKDVIQPEPRKAKHVKPDPKIVAKTPKKKTVEPTQEETPSNKTVEPTVEDTNTNPSLIQQRPPAPTVSLLPGQIHSSRPYALMPRSKSYSKSRKTDSLSGRHDLSMQVMVENPIQTLKDRKPSLNVHEMQKFYPAEKRPHYLDRREIALLCCRISVMFKIVEELITAAEQKLVSLGAVFDGNGFISELPQKALDFLVSAKCPEFIRSFAFGNIFRNEIDSSLGKKPTSAIPLLFVVILQRRYTAEDRRKASAWIRRQLPILRIEFSINEREKLHYPMNAVEYAAEMDRDGFTNVEDLFTHSKEEKARDAEKKAKKNPLGEMRRKTKKRR